MIPTYTLDAPMLASLLAMDLLFAIVTYRIAFNRGIDEAYDDGFDSGYTTGYDTAFEDAHGMPIIDYAVEAEDHEPFDEPVYYGHADKEYHDLNF
jgi:hypothetical protein